MPVFNILRMFLSIAWMVAVLARSNLLAEGAVWGLRFRAVMVRVLVHGVYIHTRGIFLRLLRETMTVHTNQISKGECENAP